MYSLFDTLEIPTARQSRNLGTKSFDTLVQSGTNIQRLWELPKQRYSGLALMSPKQLAENRVNVCWYSKTLEWFKSYGISRTALPLYQYSLNCPHPTWTKFSRTEWCGQILSNSRTKEHWSALQHHWLAIEYADMHTHLWKAESCVIREWDLKKTTPSAVLFLWNKPEMPLPL